MRGQRSWLCIALCACLGIGGARSAASQQLSLPPPPADWHRLPPVDAAEVTVPIVPARPAAEEPRTPAPPPADTEVLADEEVAELETWFVPSNWIDATAWDGSVELGLTGTDGNSEAFTLRTGGNLKRKTKVYEIGGDLTYLKANTGGVESQHRLLSNMSYERLLGETRWSYFLKSFVEYDEFKAFDLRVTGNTGVGYLLVRTEQLKFKARLGAGAYREYGSPDDDVQPEAAFGCDYDWELNDRQKLTAVTDYFPQWDDFGDYRLNTSVNWELLLDETANLSLKLSVSNRYDSTPYGLRPNDVDYGVLLLWKI
jgi:putative salt-induced outer membrane protein YdiY